MSPLIVEHVPDRSLSTVFSSYFILVRHRVSDSFFMSSFYLFFVNSRMRSFTKERLIRPVLITTGHTLSVRRSVKKIHPVDVYSGDITNLSP